MSVHIAKRIISSNDFSKSIGSFFDKSHYNTIIDSDMDVYTEEGVLLLSIRKNIIPEEISSLGKKIFLKKAKSSKTPNRGIASGKIDISKLSKNVSEILDQDNFQSRVKYNDGRISKYKVCNRVNSMIAGNYDGRDISAYKKKDVQHSKEKGRPTAFTNNNPNEWKQFIPLLQCLDKLYEQVNKEQYEKQKETVSNSNYLIDNTIFTTVTINYNFRTAAHKDKGNLDNSNSIFIVCESGSWEGSYLGYPEYGVCVNVREGDFVLMNPHVYHCNTEIENAKSDYSRLSFVIYARKGLL